MLTLGDKIINAKNVIAKDCLICPIIDAKNNNVYLGLFKYINNESLTTTLSGIVFSTNF
mgnify:CR=1 FL=1